MPKYHTISIQYLPEEYAFALYSVDDGGNMSYLGDEYCFHDFLNAQQVALMLLSDNNDVRFSIKPVEPSDA